MTTLWRTARSLRNHVPSNEDVEHSERWVNHFAKKVCPDSAPPELIRFDSDEDSSDSAFSMMEFSMALLSCNNSAPGLDGIRFSLLKNLPDVAKRRLLNLFNRLLELNLVPEEWRQVRVIAIQKPGKPAADHNSYRPIAMLSCLRKLLEKMILKRLDDWAEGNQLISATQFGFRRGKGTSDCLALLATEAQIAFDSKQEMASVFLDIKGAFDNVSLAVLSKKLHLSGLSAILNNFLTNLLSEKHMYFSHGSTTIKRVSYMGIPQGSCLSPILYNIYVNDIDDCLRGSCSLLQLADDAVVSFTGPNNMQSPLQDSLNCLSDWAIRMGIEFSAEKTRLLVFSRKHNPSSLDLTLLGQPVEQVFSHKYLGVYFDSKCKWRSQIEYLKQKCQPRINFLRTITGTWWGAHPESMIRLLKTTVLSVLEYGSFCFKDAADTHLVKLERIQFRGIRIALGSMHSTHTKSLEVLAGVLPLKCRFFELALRFLIRSEIKNPQVIDNFERLLEVNQQSKCMRIYYIFMSQDINSLDLSSHITNTELRSDHVSFDLSMREEIRNIPDHMKSVVIPTLFANKYDRIDSRYTFYTDGSSIDGGTGFGIQHATHTEFFKLGSPSSVYVAELAAINRALEIIESLPPDNYYIFTDSLSSIEAIKNLRPKDHHTYFLLKICKRLNTLGIRSFRISLVWVPAHCSIPGNEMADELAKKGAIEGDVIDRPIAYHEYFPLAHQLTLAEWQRQWDESEKGRLLYSIHPKVSTKAWFKGLDLTRNFIRVMSRLMSNHYRSNAHHFRIKMSDTNLCVCESGYDDIDHIIWSCTLHNDARSKLLIALRQSGRPPETPVRDVLARLDLDFMKLLYDFLKSSNIHL